MEVDKLVSLTRPIVTVILISTLCWIVVTTVKPETVDFKDFINLVTLVALFWFKSRDDEKRADTVERVVRQATAEQRIIDGAAIDTAARTRTGLV